MSDPRTRPQPIEPRDIAGSDLPNYVQHRGPWQGFINSMPVAIVLWGIIAVTIVELVANWPKGWVL